MGYLLHQYELLLPLLLLSLAPRVQVPPGPWGQGSLSLHGAAGTSQASSRGRRARVWEVSGVNPGPGTCPT